MLTAIIAAVVAALVVIAIIVVVFAVRSRTKSPYDSGSIAKRVKSISSFGLGASDIEKDARRASGPSDDIHATGDGALARPSDSLKSRFTAVAVFSAAVFGSLAAKMWSMQVLSSSTYASKAESNLYTTVYTPAPRGYICDAEGIPLVKNRACLTVLADPDAANDRDVVLRLSAVLGVPVNVVRQRIQDASAGAQSQRTVATDVRLRDVAFISEHADAFPGITVQSRTVRDYPFGALAAHALGYTGAVSQGDLENVEEGRALKSTDEVGKSGMEYTYDKLLAGDHGQRQVVVDAKGNIVEVVSETQPSRGSDVYLTINGPVQYICDRALAKLVAPEDATIGTGKGVAAAAVAMDVRDGSIIAMASYPTYEPEKFVGGISTDDWSIYNSEVSQAPLNNRVINGLYAAASTFKAFTGLAGLKYGFADTEKEWHCTGSWDGFETGAPQKCWARYGHDDLNFREGIVQSCDVVFYEIAKCFFDESISQGGEIDDLALQNELMKYNFGTATGIDLAGESAGRVPTPAWKAEHWKNVPSEAGWVGGDYTNMIIGQGDVQVTPLQIAVAYGGIATGRIVKPHLLKEVRNAQGDVVVTFEPEVVTTPEVDPKHLDIVRDALHGVVQDSEIKWYFEPYGVDAAGKTGTAEHTTKSDDAWFVCYAPYDDPKYVVACVVEQGGGGSAVAAPLGAEIMRAVMAADAGNLEKVMGRIAGSTGKFVERKDEEKTSRVD